MTAFNREHLIQLPKEFVQRMELSLGEEAKAFLSSFDREQTYGLRLNPLKNGGSLSYAHLPFTLSPIPWAEEGYFAIRGERPGKHPLHEAGAYYIQEPSAMSPVSLLDPRPGEIICDLCAAPGGKSTDIAGRMKGEGFLLSNEIIAGRAKILSRNIERMGIANCVVTNETPARLSQAFPFFFDKVLVDAPCSGEGMFRKEPQALADWSPSLVDMCQQRQADILKEADRLLRPGGILVYSTCTFAPEEDENQIAAFLAAHPDYRLEDWRDYLPSHCGLSGGRKWQDTPDFLEADKTLRLWPHLLRGEGHFAARLRKTGEPSPQQKRKSPKKKKEKQKTPEELLLFRDTFLQRGPSLDSGDRTLCRHGSLHAFGEELYFVPAAMSSPRGLKILRAGLHLGSLKKRRFEPSHALAMALLPEEAVQTFPCDEESVLAYLRGEALPCSPQLHSWTLVTYQGVSLGWGKASGGTLKNHYPRGLRIY